MITNKENAALRISYWVVILGISFFICQYFVSGITLEMPRHTLDELMNGTAHKPFVYRVLFPSLIKLAVTIVPLSPKFYASLFIYFFLIAFVVVMRSFVALFWPSTKIVDFIGLLSLVLLLPLTITSREIYDFSTLFLFTLAFYVMAKAKWNSFLLIYILSCLNKETTLLLTLFYVLCFWHRRNEKIFWKLLMLQIVIFVVIRGLIVWNFRNNLGESIENHFEVHIRALRVEPLLVSIYIGIGLLAVIAALKDWKKKPFFIRQAFLATFPLLYVLYLLGGYPLEIRVFYEAYPAILPLALPSLIPNLGTQFWDVQQPNVTDRSSVLLKINKEI